LDKNYPKKEDKDAVKDISRISGIDGGELDLSGYPNLEIVWLDGSGLKSPFTKLKLGQQPKLIKLDCDRNHLTSLDISACPNLKKLDCMENFLTELDLSKNKMLERLDISNNNFSQRNLTMLSHLVNLERLWLGNGGGSRYESGYSSERIQKNICNRFAGSLQYLQNLTRLEKLDVSDTDIDSGLEYLPDSLEEFSCLVDERPEAKCKTIYKLLESLEGESVPQKLQAYKQKFQEKSQQQSQIQIPPK